jgi:hypothetical protein
MDKTDNYMLLLIGVLLVALIAVELIPMPEASYPAQPAQNPSQPAYKPPKISSASLTSVRVIPTSTLAIVTIS